MEKKMEVEFKDAIVDIVREYWQSISKAILLSQLGQFLGKRGYNVRSELGSRKLKEFIESELVDSLTVMPSSSDPLVYVVLPRGAVEKYESLSSKNAVMGDTKVERQPVASYSRALWAAFSRSLADDRVRRVYLTPTIHYRDFMSDDQPSDEGIEVDRVSIVDDNEPSQGARRVKISENIESWLEKNQICAEQISAKRHTHTKAVASKHSLLDAIINSIPPTDRKRVALPLDIVAMLASTTVSRA
jgi:hypothetical protein